MPSDGPIRCRRPVNGWARGVASTTCVERPRGAPHVVQLEVDAALYNRTAQRGHLK
jgi:hypothetical protein